MENRIETLTVLSTTADDELHSDKQQKKLGLAHQDSGIAKSDKLVEAAISHARSAYEAESSFKSLVPPPPQTEAKNARIARSRTFASQESDSYFSTHDTTATLPPKTGYLSPCSDWSQPPSSTHCTSCGIYPPSHAMRIDAAPLPEYGMEVRVDLCHNCHVAQGVLRHVRYLGWLYEVDGRGRSAIRLAWKEVREVMRKVAKMNEKEEEIIIEDDLTEETKAHAENKGTNIGGLNCPTRVTVG